MKYLLFALLMMVTALALTSCKQGANGQQNQDMGKTLTVDNDEFEKIIANKDSVVLVDVRTQEEYAMYDMREIFVSFVCTLLRGICTEKGIAKLDSFLQENELV